MSEERITFACIVSESELRRNLADFFKEQIRWAKVKAALTGIALDRASGALSSFSRALCLAGWQRCSRRSRPAGYASRSAAAHEARAAELLNEADPARCARGCGFAWPPVAHVHLRCSLVGSVPWGTDYLGLH